MANEEKHEPIRQSVHVDCSPEDAFRLFTEQFGEWWPGDPNATHEIEPWKDGKIVERTPSGDEREWGAVTTWDPPDRLEFTWHAEPNTDRAGTVEIEFTVEADGTRVTLTHTNWHLAHSDLVCFAGFVHEMMAVA
jgi:uncharacterized protein YndB with AHSA1/START domain